MVGSVCLFRARPMLDHYRFANQIGRLKREVLHTKRLAEGASTDIEIQLWEERGVLKFTRKTDEPLNFPGVLNKTIKFDHLFIKEEKKIVILFTSSGAVRGNRELTLTNGKESVLFSNFFSFLAVD